LLGVALFIAFWVVLALVVFFVATAGGPRGARRTLQAPSYRGSRALGLLMVLVYVGFGVAVPLVFLSGNHANANDQVGGQPLTAAEKRGRETFAFRCGFCHTLAAANSTGKVGPNLDQIKPSKQLVLHTIQYGCLQSPGSDRQASCLGYGTMPAGIIQGRQADDVASFVAKVAGNE
jgi:mono/diheme cytochrome c family protein